MRGLPSATKLCPCTEQLFSTGTMALVPVMFLAQSRKFRGFYRRNKRPLFNAAAGVLTFGLALEVFGKQKRMQALEARAAEAETALASLQGVVTSEKWARGAARAMGAPDGSYVALLKSVRPFIHKLQRHAALEATSGGSTGVRTGVQPTQDQLPPAPPELHSLVRHGLAGSQPKAPTEGEAGAQPSHNRRGQAQPAREQWVSQAIASDQRRNAVVASPDQVHELSSSSSKPAAAADDAATPLHKRAGFM